MKALSVRQPWAGLIACGAKDIENRTWNTSYRGTLAICAGKSLGASQTEAEYLFSKFNASATATGVLVCIVDLVGVISEQNGVYSWDLPDPFPSLDDSCFAGPFGWVLENARLVKPVPVSGKLGLFEIPDALILPV